MTNFFVPQLFTQLKLARNILIIVASGSDLDLVAAALALKQFWGEQDKQIRILSANPIASRLSFLSGSEELKLLATLVKNAVVEVDLRRTRLSELTYQKQVEKLSIFLSPQAGEFTSSEIVVKTAVYPFDLIVTLGVSNLEHLGTDYEKNTTLFFEVPIINIDYRPSNESFGAINLVRLTASSVSEVVFDLLHEYESTKIDESIATLLLTGLIAQTNSFQSKQTTPQVFTKASTLVSMGANQQEIIGKLYRTKSMGLLRLWGRVLARLKHEPKNELIYSFVSRTDIQKAEATLVDLDEIIFEMKQQLTFGKIHLFLVEKEGSTTGYLSTGLPFDLKQIFADFHLENLSEQVLKFTVPVDMVQTEKTILAALDQSSS